MRLRLCIPIVFALVCAGTSRTNAQSWPIDTAFSEPANLGLQKKALEAYESSGRYERDIEAVVREAESYLAGQTRRRGKLAVVLDIDETSLSNWPQMKANDFGFFRLGACDITSQGRVLPPCGWDEWISLKRGAAIVPTLHLFRQAKTLGFQVFFITTRHESQRTVTASNLRYVGYEGWKAEDLVMIPDRLDPSSDSRLRACFASEAPAACFKTEKRGEIIDKGYTIVLNLGDQQSDLSGGYAERVFKLPNPFYYIP